MYVKEIVLDGFKSYAKRTVIDRWDTQFNCITGLNGSGKSNILDAICFVLGITTMSTVRASNQQDLIYKRGQAGVTKASVSIVFDNSDKSRSPIDYKTADTITVTRQVVVGGTSKYLINGHRAQQNQVQSMFQEVQLNVNNPNFLIMQGQITKVVNMQPPEILSLIEEAAGTGLYEKERVKAVREMDNREGDLRQSETLAQEEVRPRLEEMREKKRLFLEYQQCAASIESTEKAVAVSEYTLCSAKLQDVEQLNETRAVRAEELQAGIEVETAKQREIEERREQLRQQQQSLAAQNLDAELQQLTEEQLRIRGELENKQEQLNSAAQEFEAESATARQIAQRLQTHNDGVESFESVHRDLLAKFEAQKKLVAEKRELLTGLETGISSSGERETGFAYTSKRAREALKEAQTELASAEAELERLASRSEAENGVLESVKMDEAKLAEATQSQQRKLEELDAVKSSAEDMARLRETRQELRDTMSTVSRDIENVMARYPNLDIPVDRKNPNWSQIRGRLAHVFQVKPEHDDKLLALETCAGGALWNLVVDNDKVGAAVLEHARLRMTVLPLNRLNPKVLTPAMVAQIDAEGAWLASDLLDFTADVRPAIEHVFGRTVICKTDRIAERAAFTFNTRAVTLKGDMFDPRGVISGGFNKRDNLGALTSFAAVKQYQQFAEQHLQCEQQLSEIEERMTALSQSALLADRTKNELDLLEHEVELLTKKLDGSRASLAEAEAQQARLSDLQSAVIPELERQVAAQNEALQRALNDAEEFNRDRSGKLRELRREVETAVALEQQLNTQLEEQSAEHSRNQFELSQLRADLSQATQARDKAELVQRELSVEVQGLTSEDTAKSAEVRDVELQLQRETEKLASVRSDFQEIEDRAEQVRAAIAEMNRELQRCQYSLEAEKDAMRAVQQDLARVCKRWPWAQELAEKDSTQLVEGAELAQLRQDLAQGQARMNELAQQVDQDVLSQIQRLEGEEGTLRHRIAVIKQDKRKIEEVMETLSTRRRSKIDSVWRQVSTDFGLIFADLLPGSHCELEPVDGKPIENGFIIKVRLGGTWKEGLTELSGGQRSLVALSLILALLRYHPAPVYILDEVDSALDVHHTSNIGHIIKTRFKSAQFIVVSLKDDMFTNANRIFQTKFVDGTSTVAVAN